MPQKWSPPKGISIVYKGKGFRKKAQREGDETKEKESKKDESEEDSA